MKPLYSIRKGFLPRPSVHPINKVLSLFFLHFLLYTQAQSTVEEEKTHWKAEWISAIGHKNEPNTWTAFGKTFEVKKVPTKALAKIACDSKYWMWINGTLTVFEGQLKRGPNPNDTYYDEVDISSFFKVGDNSIFVLVWYFGKEGFTFNNFSKSSRFLGFSLFFLTYSF